MQFVISGAFSDPLHLCAIARAAEEAGFGHFALSDHVVHPEKIATPYPYTPDGKPRWEPFTPWPDPWVAIGAMSAVTSRLRFYTSVYVLGMRSPFLAAKTLATAAVMSRGRVSLGVGAGWMRDEFELMGQPFERRGKRLDEMIAVMRKLWQGGFVEHHGEFYDFPPLEMSPAPAEPIPVLVGGVSEPALKRAAAIADGWISDLHTSDELAALIEKVKRYREQSDRAGEPFEIFASVSDAYDMRGYERLASLGVDHLVTMPWFFYGGETDSLDRKREGIARFGEDVIAQMS